MKVKDLILFMEHQKLKSEGLYPEEIDEVITLLKEGDKYKKVLENIINSRYFSAIDLNYINSIKQIYFSKEGK